jgi:hypothetical protein
METSACTTAIAPRATALHVINPLAIDPLDLDIALPLTTAERIPLPTTPRHPRLLLPRLLPRLPPIRSSSSHFP